MLERGSWFFSGLNRADVGVYTDSFIAFDLTIAPFDVRGATYAFLVACESSEEDSLPGTEPVYAGLPEMV